VAGVALMGDGTGTPPAARRVSPWRSSKLLRCIGTFPGGRRHQGVPGAPVPRSTQRGAEGPWAL